MITKKYVMEMTDELYQKFVEIGKKLNSTDFTTVLSFCANAGVTSLNTLEAEKANKKFIEQCEDWLLHPTNFDGSNVVLLPPEGKTSEEVYALCAAHVAVLNEVAVMTCWKPTKDHIEEIAKTGKIWIVMMGVSAPPMMVAVKKPTDYEWINFIMKG